MSLSKLISKPMEIAEVVDPNIRQHALEYLLGGAAAAGCAGALFYLRLFKPEDMKETTALLHKDEVPHPVWVDNHYIHHGYRPQMTAWECVKSVFQLHNETFNIWSHAIGTAYAIILLLRRSNRFDAPSILLYAQICMFGVSTIAHTFSALSPEACTRLFQADRAMIAMQLGIVAIAISRIYFQNDTSSFRRYASICTLFALISSKQVFFGGGQLKTVLSIAVLVPLLLFPVFLQFRNGPSGLGIRSILATHAPFCVSMICAAGAAYGLKIPERWFPGKCDLSGTGHNMMHVLVMICAWAAYRGSSIWHSRLSRYHASAGAAVAAASSIVGAAPVPGTAADIVALLSRK